MKIERDMDSFLEDRCIDIDQYIVPAEPDNVNGGTLGDHTNRIKHYTVRARKFQMHFAAREVFAAHDGWPSAAQSMYVYMRESYKLEEVIDRLEHWKYFIRKKEVLKRISTFCRKK
eukprot:SAG11_NODE_474_length_9142_cov_6.507907_6_plen_116_part_00